MPALGATTVSRTINILNEERILIPDTLPGPSDRYWHRVAAPMHHHFTPNACGRTFDVPGCDLGFEGVAQPGYAVLIYDDALYGVCLRCGEAGEDS